MSGKIDPNSLVREINGVHGFLYQGHTYIYIKDVAKILRLGNIYGINWSRMHELFYNSMRLLRINPEDYPFPLNHVPSPNKKGPISDNERDLPEWVMGEILSKMAQSKVKDYFFTNYIEAIQYQFKDISNIIEFENNVHPEIHYLEESTMNTNQNNVHPEAQYSIKKMNELGIDLKTCPDGESQVKGFIKNNDIYLNSKDAAFMIGLYFDDGKYPRIRWNLVFKYFKMYSSMFGYNVANEGFDFRDPSNKAGVSSKYEVMVPEYIPFKIVFMMANNLNNPRACKFRFDIIFTILPFFIDNASQEEINKIEFLSTIAPLIMQYRSRYPQFEQFINRPPQMLNFSPTGYRPAIPFWDGSQVQTTTMAYQMPSPEEIQKNLDAQKSTDGRELKDVVRFVKQDNKEE